MSDFLKPCLYNKRGLENQLQNLCFNAHDLCCGCQNPSEHLRYLFNKEKCLPTVATTGTETAGTTGKDVLDDLEEGVLEQMFAEDLTEEDSG